MPHFYLLRNLCYTFFTLILLVNCTNENSQGIEPPISEMPEREPKVIDLSTNSADIGDTITINGSGFSSEDNYILKLNDVEVTIIEIDASSITFRVPENVISGNLVLSFKEKSVAVGEIVIEILVNGISKDYVKQGDEVEIIGKNFSTSIEYDITINDLQVPVNILSNTSLTIQVPEQASTGDLILSFLDRNENLGRLVISKIFEGDVILSTQFEVDEFGEAAYTEISGFLIIGSQSSISTSINNVQELESLRVVGKGVDIIRNTALTNLKGLENLTYVGEWFQVYHCDALITLEGLAISSNITSINIANNYNLVSLEGLNNIGSSIKHLTIWGNRKLNDITQLSNITTISGNFRIVENQNLKTLAGLENVQNINGRFYITSTFLTSLDGLNGLQSIGGNIDINNNFQLLNIDALENLEVLGGGLRFVSNDAVINLDGFKNVIALGGEPGLQILFNDNLIDFCGLTKSFQNGFNYFYYVSGNAINPSVEELINGTCK